MTRHQSRVRAPIRPRRAKPSWDPRWRIFAIALAALLFAGVPVAAVTRHPGALSPLLLFEASFGLMLALALPRPRRYGYTFLAVFLFLGFWAKFNLHTLLDYRYNEPIGAFDGSGSSWDEALLVSAFGALGVSVARLVQLMIARRRPRPVGRDAAQRYSISRAPPWYESRRSLVWIATVAGGVLLNVTNVFFDWYQIGVDANITLPAHANVVMTWMVKLGFALWIAMLIYWEAGRPDAKLSRLLLVPIVEAAAVTTTCLSRGIYLYRVLPYVAVVAEQRRRFLRALGPRRLAMVAAVAAVAFVAGLFAASTLRLVVYPPAVSESASTTPHVALAEPGLDAERISDAFREVTGLVVERWNGMEGVMAVTAHHGLEPRLLVDAIKESPDAGEDAIYQRIARANVVYGDRGGFTFLTLPGVVAIVNYSGSLPIVFLGLALVTGLVLAIEGLLLRFNPNPFLASVAGMGMAVELTQANFPYLAGVFFLLLCLSLLLLSLLERVPTFRRGGAAQTPVTQA